MLRLYYIAAVHSWETSFHPAGGIYGNVIYFSWTFLVWVARLSFSFELSRGQRVCSPGYDPTQSTLRCERYSLLPNGQGRTVRCSKTDTLIPQSRTKEKAKRTQKENRNRRVRLTVVSAPTGIEICLCQTRDESCAIIIAFAGRTSLKPFCCRSPELHFVIAWHFNISTGCARVAARGNQV